MQIDCIKVSYITNLIRNVDFNDVCKNMIKMYEHGLDQSNYEELHLIVDVITKF